MADLEYPEDLRYTTDHEWVRQLDSETVEVGITAYAQDALGDVVYVDLPEVGADVSAGESCGEVESTKSVSDLISPLTGTVSEINPDLEGTPDLVNTAPYTGGWMYRMTPADINDVEDLLDAKSYAADLD